MTTLLALNLAPQSVYGFSYIEASREVDSLGAPNSTAQFGYWDGGSSGQVCIAPDDIENCSASGARQISDLARRHISISSRIGGWSEDGPPPRGSSTLSVSFTLNHPHTFVAVGSYTVEGEGSPLKLEMSASLLGPQGQIFAISDISDHVAFDKIDGVISESGFLPAGDYDLLYHFSGRARWLLLSGRSDLDLSFTVAPESGTLALMASGLLGLAFKRQRTIGAGRP